MNTNLPGGKGQPTSAAVNVNPAQPSTSGRTVRIERLQKLSVEQLEAKIANLPNKIKRKTEAVEKRTAMLRERLATYESFKKAEVEVCKRLLLEKRKATPNAGSPAKAA